MQLLRRDRDRATLYVTTPSDDQVPCTLLLLQAQPRDIARSDEAAALVSRVHYLEAEVEKLGQQQMELGLVDAPPPAPQWDATAARNTWLLWQQTICNFVWNVGVASLRVAAFSLIALFCANAFPPMQVGGTTVRMGLFWAALIMGANIMLITEVVRQVFETVIDVCDTCARRNVRERVCW